MSKQPASLDRWLSLREAMRRWLPTLVLAVLAAASAWLLRQVDPDELASEKQARHNPDFFMEDFQSTTMDEMGKPKRLLEAVRLVHYPDTDTNELTRPYLILFHPTRPPWHIRSERGWVSATGEVVLLLGNVHAWRNDEQGERDLDIHTRDLRVLPDDEYGETDKPAVIRTPTSETRGVGVRAYLEEDRVELLSQVTTIYEKRCPRGSAAATRRPGACAARE